MKQFAVIHIEKRKEISAVLDRHITRTEVTYEAGERIEKEWAPNNADTERTRLNKELVPREVIDPETGRKKNLTISQAVKKRIREASVDKIRTNQNIALEVIMTGSPETMNNLDDEQLGSWAEMSLDWARKQWGAENIVSAVLHMDEKTPHIHLIVVPIVQGVSRRTLAKEKELKRKGIIMKSKPKCNRVNRLCANDLVTRSLLSSYHTSYAEEVGAHFGLERGVQAEAGSRKKHQSSIEYNRELMRQELEEKSLIAELKGDYEERQKLLGQTDEALLSAQQQLDIINDSLASVEERKRRTEKELEEDEERLKEAKARFKNVVEAGLDIEKQVRDRETYLRSLSSMSYWKMQERIPEMIKEDLSRILNKRFAGRVEEFERVERPVREDDKSTLETFIHLKVTRDDEGAPYEMMVRETDASVWSDGRPYRSRDGKVATLPGIIDYFSRELTPEGKEFVESLFKRPAETKVEESDPVIARMEEEIGEVGVVSVTALNTSGKETGKMYHLVTRDKKFTAVSDYAAKEICYCNGHARKGVFYLEVWRTLSGKPAISVGNRVYSQEYKRKHGQGRGI